MTKQLLIRGNSAAALAAVRAIRAHGESEPVTIVSGEACSAYSPVLTTYYLRGVIPGQQLNLCDAHYYLDHNIDCHFGKAAVGLDTDAQWLTLEDGSSLTDDALLIAAGPSPKRLGGELDPGLAAEICHLRTIQCLEVR